MKAYVAGRTSDIERVNRVQWALRDFGYEITFDWTGREGDIRSGWEEHREIGRRLAKRERQACRDADLVVLVWKDPEPDGPIRTGMVGALIEVGMALGHDSPAEVWIVGPTRDSVFFCLPEVRVLPGVHSVRLELASQDRRMDEYV